MKRCSWCRKSLTGTPSRVRHKKFCDMRCMGRFKSTLIGSANPRYLHGGSKTKLFGVWVAMRARCAHGRRPRKYWAQRGIVVCHEWQSFAAFKQWATSHGYNEGLQIDRVDWRGNYHPDNCRWVTPKIQAENRSTTIATDKFCARVIHLSNAGLQINEIAKALGCSQRPICRIRNLSRINTGVWSMDKLVTKQRKKAGGHWNIETVLP